MTFDQHRLFQQPWPEGDYRHFQLGFVVDDLFTAAERWTTVFGVGPFHVLPRMEVAGTYRGVRSGVDLQVAAAYSGPVQIELMQQFCDRPSIFRDLFDPGGTGLHQLSTVTNDYDGTKAHYERLGFALASELEATQRVAFYDTSAEFGFMTEVVESSPAFLSLLAGIADTCANWDGTDPIRIITRDGYRTP